MFSGWIIVKNRTTENAIDCRVLSRGPADYVVNQFPYRRDRETEFLRRPLYRVRNLPHLGLPKGKPDHRDEKLLSQKGNEKYFVQSFPETHLSQTWIQYM